MEEQLSKLYSEYGRYINQYRAFPLVYDGLKIVERRLLYSLYERAKDKLVKSAEVVGWTIGQYHPHGDQSAYGSLVQLVNGGMAVGQGNWGADYGISSCPPAAMRYTECKTHKVMLQMAFEFIDYVKKEELELKAEPLFLPTKLPLCLVNTNNTQGIGFGSRTNIPSYTITDLVKRLRWLLGYEKEEPIIRPLTDCTYLSNDADFRKLLTTGHAKIEYKGKVQIDYSNKSVVVKSTPPSKSFATILKKLESDIQIQKTIGFIDESTTSTKVRFVSLKRSLPLKRLMSKIENHLLGSMTFECNMCDRVGNVVLVSIDDMLLNVYKNYLQVNEAVLKSNIAKLKSEIDELKLIARIKKVLPKWLRSNPDEPEVLIQGVSQDAKINIEVVDKLFQKYNIKRLLKVKVDIDKLESSVKILQGNLDNLDNFVWNEKYSSLLGA